MKHDNAMKTFFVIAAIILIAAFINACQTTSVTAPAAQAPISGTIPPLSWESGHSERASWSDQLSIHFIDNLATYQKASDIKTFCPKFASIEKVQQVHALDELWVAVSYFESSWNPKSSSVDVGEAGSKDTYSVGLYQISVVDQKNYGFKFGYTYNDLLTPIPNIKLALAILKRQVEKYGVIAIPAGSKGLYWAVLHPGGKYDKTAAIAARVVKNVAGCE